MTGYQIKIDDRYYVKVRVNDFYSEEELAREGWFSYESYKLEKLEWTKDKNKAGYVTIRNLEVMIDGENCKELSRVLNKKVKDLEKCRENLIIQL